MASKTGKIVGQLLADNPQLSAVSGKAHVKLYVDGHLVGILPHRLAQEGLAKNSVSQLRRAGLKVTA